MSSTYPPLPPPTSRLTLRLAGVGGEPVDLWRTLISHGMVSLPPMALDEDARRLELTLPMDGYRPRTVRIAGRGPDARIDVFGPRANAGEIKEIKRSVGHVLRLDEDLSPLYHAVQDDPDLRWVTSGAGRMIRSPTVFEEVVKTICTTNCSWALTERMVSALVEDLGRPAPGVAHRGPWGRAFPTPEAMAGKDEAFYRDVVRAGYRAPYLVALAGSVAGGAIGLEELAHAPAEEIPDEEVERRLLALPGVGPYAVAHIMMMLGRYSRLILDSWTRAKYARLIGCKTIKDSTIERRFRRYGPYAGLAFWLFVTSDWVTEHPEIAAQD
ncbi:MAG: Fe-S cluster assembly protein HesB [Actinobacteria bacterium]|nr:Fe-S cluster assembly protein HesB [Actinomycetota bacterium]